ncbi:TBC1 domain family member 30-like protein, partial [Dinothrombium tinctorium]
MRFSVEPYPGDSGFSQWHDAMRMVARLAGGIPNEFRNKLWSTLANRHIQSRKIRWSSTLKFCLNEKSNPDDEALGEQIVKDLHRTGCSLFSGEDSEQNQALLKQVLLAFARWNKDVGYCQGFNMLAAIILEVMNGDVEDAL